MQEGLAERKLRGGRESGAAPGLRERKTEGGSYVSRNGLGKETEALASVPSLPHSLMLATPLDISHLMLWAG